MADDLMLSYISEVLHVTGVLQVAGPATGHANGHNGEPLLESAQRGEATLELPTAIASWEEIDPLFGVEIAGSAPLYTLLGTGLSPVASAESGSDVDAGRGGNRPSLHDVQSVSESAVSGGGAEDTSTKLKRGRRKRVPKPAPERHSAGAPSSYLCFRSTCQQPVLVDFDAGLEHGDVCRCGNCGSVQGYCASCDGFFDPSRVICARREASDSYARNGHHPLSHPPRSNHGGRLLKRPPTSPLAEERRSRPARRVFGGFDPEESPRAVPSV